MDSNTIFFSSTKFHTPTHQPPPSSSSSLLSSSANHSLISRQFLGFNYTHRLPGASSSSLRKKHRNLAFPRLASPRFTVRASIDSNLVLVVIGVTAFSALSLACYNQFFRKSQSLKRVSGSSSSALPQQHEETNLAVHTSNCQILGIGDLPRETFAKGVDNLADKQRETTEASESTEVPLQFQEATMVNDDSRREAFARDEDNFEDKQKETIEASGSTEVPFQFQEANVLNDYSLLSKTSESSGADSLVFTADDSDASEESGITDPPFPHTVLLESGAVQPLMFATEMSELHQEEVERVNKLEADLPRLAIEPMSGTSLCLTQDAHVLVEESEVIRQYDILKEPVREELHTFYEADQVLAKSLTNLNGLKSEASYVSFSSLKQNRELSRAQLSAKNSLQTADMVEGKVAKACSKGDSSSKRKNFGRGREFRREKDNGPLIQEKDSKFPQSPFPSGMPANNPHHPEDHFSSYNRLLRDGRLSDCVDILEYMEQKGLLDMNMVYHAKFFKICNKKKAVKEAFRFTKLIPDPTLSTFNMLMSVCACSQDSEGAFEVLRLVQEAGFKADCKLYTTLISTCAKSGKVDTMFEVFHEMVNRGVEPNVNTYGALIDGCARAGQVAKAFGAYGIMRSKNVKPDRVVFNALIAACGQSGLVDRAFDVLAEMLAETQPIDPDHITVGALIKACANAGQVDRAREVYQMINKFNIKGTPEVYTIAINCCSQNGDLEFACSVYSDMKRKGVAPDEVFISALIDVAGHAGNLDAAFEIIEAAKDQGINIGIVSYSSLMGACSNAKNWQKAVELYESMKTLKLKLTVSTLNALITSLCEADQLPKAMEILSEMKEFGLCPNTITYSILLVASERKDDLEVSLTLLSEARNDGVAPNLIMSRCIIGMCLRRFHKACAVGEPVLSFNSGRPHIENKWTSVALTVYRESIIAGTIPTMEVVSQILGCLKLPLDDTLKSRLVDNLEVNADSSRSSSLSSLIDGFGEYDPRAFSLLEEAASFGIVPFVSFKESPIVVDARELQINTAEVYLLTILRGLKHRLAAGAKLPSISILLPLEKKKIMTPEKEKSINLAGRMGRAIAALLRRIGLPYQGNESYGKIRINGLALKRWSQPKLVSPFTGKPGEWNVSEMRLRKGISHQQRSIRTGNLSLD